MKAGTDYEYVNMIIEQEVSSKSPVILAGFPGIGLVGNIVATQIASELKMTQIGTIESRLFPPITVLFDGLTHAPVRIYEDPQNNFIVVLSDILIHPMIAYDIGKAVIGWAQSLNAKLNIPIAGIATMREERTVYAAATSAEQLSLVKDKTETLVTGSISGIAGSIMNESHINKLPALCLLGETQGPTPDPRAAARVIDVVSNVLNVTISTQKLVEEADQIETELHKLAEQVQGAEQAETKGPTQVMYG
ncbi:MAG TPA: proteasome assembly chaperone family protein [Candidatus Bathyarchaeia archaeon]|nr:proteasome assembly chaperone family protein [Candidatus Bathyarchaeia archaeon]